MDSLETDPEKEGGCILPPVSRVESLLCEATYQEEALDAQANIPHLPAIGPTAEKDQSPGPPPNGGWYAWLQVLGSFFLFFNSW